MQDTAYPHVQNDSPAKPALTHSFIHHFETIPNSKTLQTDCIENIVEKGEIAHFELVSPFSAMFS